MKLQPGDGKFSLALRLKAGENSYNGATKAESDRINMFSVQNNFNKASVTWWLLPLNNATNYCHFIIHFILYCHARLLHP